MESADVVGQKILPIYTYYTIKNLRYQPLFQVFLELFFGLVFMIV